MANVAKKKITYNGSVISPRTSLDNIVPSSDETVFSTTNSTILNTSGKIKSDYIELPSNVVLTTDGKISTLVLPPVVPLLEDGKIPKAYIPGSVDDIIQLIAYSANAPQSGMSAGDQYYNSQDKKIYTYSSSWGSAADPVTSVIYYVPSTGKTYRWSPDNNPNDNEDTSAMVEIAAAIAITKQENKTGSQLTDLDDFVPSDKAVKAYVTSVVNGSAAGVATTSTPGLVYVSGGSSSANGVTLSLNTSTGALTVTGNAPKKTGGSAYTPGVVYVEGSTNGTTPALIEGSTVNGVQLKLSQTTGKLEATGVQATTAGLGVVKIINDFSSFRTGMSNFSAGNGTQTATTPAAVKGWLDTVLTAGDGLTINTETETPSIDLATNPGLDLTGSSPNKKLTVKCNTTKGLKITANGVEINNGTGLEFDSSTGAIKLSTLTGTQVAAGLSAGDGIQSVTNGTITAKLDAIDV